VSLCGVAEGSLGMKENLVEDLRRRVEDGGGLNSTDGRETLAGTVGEPSGVVEAVAISWLNAVEAPLSVG